MVWEKECTFAKVIENYGKSKTFIKWVDGKTQLIEQLDAQLSDTSSFNDYAKEAFNDDAQIRLKEYCDRINEAGFRFMLSNSDCKGKNEKDNFFDVLYGAYNRIRIYEQNGMPNIVIRNYSKSNSDSL